MQHLQLQEDYTLKTRSASLILFCVSLAAIPAADSTLYENGPVNGQIDTWQINNGFVTSDTIRCCRMSLTNNFNVDGLEFWAWLSPGDTATSVEMSVTSSENGGTIYFDQVLSLTQSDCFLNHIGFDVCLETANISGASIGSGPYWINLFKGTTAKNGALYWDENSGVGCMSPGCPSMASQDGVGTIPSEAFTLEGAPTTPELSSIVLFGSGIFALGGVLRRKGFRRDPNG